ncbi:MAG: penicillin-binding transpeptidase domain-containing protein [Actinomycetota bacterium]
MADRGAAKQGSSARRTVIAVGASVLATLTGCGSTPDVTPAAGALAEALVSRDFNAVPVTGSTPADITAELTAITEDMGETSRTVTVERIERIERDDEDDDSVRRVTLGVSWELDHVDAEWSYETAATFELVDDEWQVAWSPSLLHPDLTPGDRLVLRREQAERAGVLGAGESLIVDERPVYRIGIDKVRVEGDDPAEPAVELADLVGVDAGRFAERVESAGDRAFVRAITLREDDAEPVLDEIEDIDGARALPDTLPLAPTREFARPVLGTVGDATAEIVDESGGRVQAGDVTGLSGLQRTYDEQLAGTPGVRVDIVPEEGDPATVFERDPEPGSPLVTTLDIDLQLLAEDILSDVEPPSAIVAVRPSTGGVLAAASGPGGGGFSTATLGQYAPGSTFKVVSSLALLRTGLEPETAVECPDTATADGRPFGNYSDYPPALLGEITLRTAFAESCNTAFIGLRDAVPQQDLAAAAASLGIGVEADLGFDAFLGSVPAEAEGTDHAASMIGQGRVVVSPLGMAAAAASIAEGKTVVPRLVDGPAGAAADTLTGEEAATLRELMRAAVEDGTADLLADVPGEPVGAKTGTAEYTSDDSSGTHGWMIAIQGDLAVAAFVEDAESGSDTAGPLLEQFLRGGAAD